MKISGCRCLCLAFMTTASLFMPSLRAEESELEGEPTSPVEETLPEEPSQESPTPSAEEQSTSVPNAESSSWLKKPWAAGLSVGNLWVNSSKLWEVSKKGYLSRIFFDFPFQVSSLTLTPSVGFLHLTAKGDTPIGEQRKVFASPYFEASAGYTLMDLAVLSAGLQLWYGKGGDMGGDRDDSPASQSLYLLRIGHRPYFAEGALVSLEYLHDISNSGRNVSAASLVVTYSCL